MRKLGLLLVAVVAGLLLVEAGFRLWGPQPIQPRRIDPGVPFVARPGNRLEYRPGASFASIYDPAFDERGYFDASGRIEYAINAFGFRGPTPDVPKPANVLRIACLGDSFTFGEGVRYDDTWPAVLAKLLNESDFAAERRVEAINAGIQGYGLLDALLWYGFRIEKFDPDVVVLAFFMNDLVDTGETIRINDEIHKAHTESGLGKYSRVVGWIQHQERAAELQSKYFWSIRNSFDAEGRQTLNDALTGFQDYARQRGVRFVLVVFPVLWGLGDDYPLKAQHETITEICDAAGIEHIDLLDVYSKTDRAESLWVHPTDQHPNEIAQAQAAKAVAERLLAR